MKIYTHTPKKKYGEVVCARCGRYKLCTWHHIDGKRYSDRWVWLCVGFGNDCHSTVHANPAQSRREGFYNRCKDLKT